MAKARISTLAAELKTNAGGRWTAEAPAKEPLTVNPARGERGGFQRVSEPTNRPGGNHLQVEPPRAAARLYDRPLLRPLLTATALAATRGPAQEGPCRGPCEEGAQGAVRGPTARLPRENASASRGAKGVRTVH